MNVSPNLIQERLAVIKDQIAEAAVRAGRSPDDVLLVAVTKTHGPDQIEAAYQAGLRHFGENRVEEAKGKIETLRERLPDDIVWHMVGHVQSRKTTGVAGYFQWIHSADRFKIARRLSETAIQSGQILDVLLEVNLSGEATDYGWIQKKYLLLWRRCLVSEKGKINSKAMILNTLETMKSMAGVSPDIVQFRKGPSTDIAKTGHEPAPPSPSEGRECDKISQPAAGGLYMLVFPDAHLQIPKKKLYYILRRPSSSPRGQDQVAVFNPQRRGHVVAFRFQDEEETVALLVQGLVVSLPLGDDHVRAVERLEKLG